MKKPPKQPIKKRESSVAQEKEAVRNLILELNCRRDELGPAAARVLAPDLNRMIIFCERVVEMFGCIENAP